MRILIAEDDAVSALVLRKSLEKLGHEVVGRRDGDEAWQTLCNEHFRLVITDWMMPNLDGIELCRRIRDRHDAFYTYVILLTAKGGRDERLMGLAAGADDFLVKPLDVSELEARLRVAERILAMEDELQERAERMKRIGDELEQSNRVMEEAISRFNELFQGVPVACVTFDEMGRVQEWNRTFMELHGLDNECIHERYLWELVRQPEDWDRVRDKVRRVFKGEHINEVEWVCKGRDGSIVNVLGSTFPMLNLKGDQIVGAISAYTDITKRRLLEKQVTLQLDESRRMNKVLEDQRVELEAVNRKLQQMVNTDGLTGLYNHRFFQDMLAQQCSLARRKSTALSVIMLDADRFKQYNDSYGHPAGDEVLRGLARILQEESRLEDTVARYGGEEFALILPMTDSESAIRAAERIRKAIEAQSWAHRQITASLGVATLDLGAETPARLIDQADRALYQSKSDGRNRVTHANVMVLSSESG